MKQDLTKSQGDFIRLVDHGVAHRLFYALHHSKLFQDHLVASILLSKSFSISILQKGTLVFLPYLSLTKKQKKIRCAPVNLTRNLVLYPVFMSILGTGKRMEGNQILPIGTGTTVFSYYNYRVQIFHFQKIKLRILDLTSGILFSHS